MEDKIMFRFRGYEFPVTPDELLSYKRLRILAVERIFQLMPSMSNQKWIQRLLLAYLAQARTHPEMLEKFEKAVIEVLEEQV